MNKKDAFFAPVNPELKKNIQQLQTVFDRLPCAFSMLDPVKNEKEEIIDFICVYVNYNTLRELKLNENEFLGRKLSEIFPRDFENLFAELFKVVSDDIPRNVKLSIYAKSSGKRKINKTLDAAIVKLNDRITLSWKDDLSDNKDGRKSKDKDSVSISRGKFESLKYSDELFSKIFYLSPDAYIISRMADGKIIQINNSAENLFGYKKKDIIGRTSNQLGLFADLKDRENAVSLLNGKGSLRDFLTVIVRKSGEKHQVSLAIEVITIGNEKYVLKSVRDISERKQIEDVLCESEKRYRVTLDNMMEGCAILGFDWNYLYINKVYSQHAHKKPEELIGRNLLEIFPGVESSVFFDCYKICMEERLAQQVESSFTFEDGSTAWYQAIVQPVPEGIFSLSIDITERKKAEEAVKESEAKLLDAQKLAHMGNYTIYVMDNNRIEWSEELYNIWELDNNKPIPPFEQLWELIHPDDREFVKEALINVNKENNKVEIEFRILFPNGRIKYIYLITRIIFDEEGNPIKRQGVEIDITERKEAMLKLERTLKELERSNADLERFAFAISHDLQEPIRMIGSYAQLITKKYEGKLNTEADTYLNIMFEGAQRLQLLVKDMLYYSQLKTNSKRNNLIDLNELIRQILVEFNKTISETNTIITTNPMPVITGDHAQIKQLFRNLLSNAIKFRKKDDRVTISLTYEERVSEWLFVVKDNGIGIEPEYINYIFTAFNRLNDRELYPGIGLGLVISRRIVERHGGRIWVESEPGTGSIFYFTISKNQDLS